MHFALERRRFEPSGRKMFLGCLLDRNRGLRRRRTGRHEKEQTKPKSQGFANHGEPKEGCQSEKTQYPQYRLDSPVVGNDSIELARWAMQSWARCEDGSARRASSLHSLHDTHAKRNPMQ